MKPDEMEIGKRVICVWPEDNKRYFGRIAVITELPNKSETYTVRWENLDEPYFARSWTGCECFEPVEGHTCQSITEQQKRRAHADKYL